MKLPSRVFIAISAFGLGISFGAVLLISGCTPVGGGAPAAMDTPTNKSTISKNVSVDLRCGDGICLPAAENSLSCPQDCRVNPLTCGDGVCNRTTTNENCFSCATDCGACVTDASLISISIVDACGTSCETSADCPDPLECAGNQCRSLFFCGTCGDRVCDALESQGDSCPADCGTECVNDGVCTENEAFVCLDCYPLAIRCGDSICNLYQENSANCAADCTCNGDHVCDPHEALSCADCRNQVSSTPTPTADPDHENHSSSGTTSGATSGGGGQVDGYEDDAGGGGGD